MRWLVENIDSENFSIESIAKKRMIGYEKVEDFFRPSMDLFHNPYMMEDMDKSVEKTFSVMRENKKILIYGDYDVDGISSVAILLKTFEKIGYKNVDYYIPKRLDEGYGLNLEACSKIVGDKVDLLITVDCGITSIDDINYLNENNVEVIVTDHHQCRDDLPEAYSILNPKKKTCDYPNSNLCGAGIAFKFATAILEKKSIKPMRELVEIAAVATVADIVDLVGENRTIVKNGLESLKNPENKGLRALIETSGFSFDYLTSSSISFGIAPRINSTGRLNNPDIAVELYMEKDDKKVIEIAKNINSMNSKRQQIENDIFQKSLEQIIITDDTYFIVVFGEGWSSGVIGIVASKITSMYNLPSAVIALDGDEGHASARSIDNLNIYKILEKTEDLLVKFGGHEQAAGFTIKKENIDKFTKKINELTRLEFEEGDYRKTEMAQSVIDISEINLETYDKISDMEPFGQANKPLSFIVRGVNLKNVRPVGKNNDHFKAEAYYNQDTIDMISFNTWDEFSEYDYLKSHDILFNIEENNFRGRKAQMKIIDLKPTLDSSSLYQKIFTGIQYLVENIKKVDRLPLNGFTTLNSDKILKFNKDSCFLCYDYESYNNLNIIIDYAGIDINNKESNIKIYFTPVVEDIDLSKFKNIILCNDREKIDLKLINSNQKKYLMPLSNKKRSYINRDDLAKYYIYLKKRQNKKVNIDKVLNDISIKIDMMILYSFIFSKMDFIDTKFDFKYNNLIIGKIKSTEKKILKEEPFIIKLMEYL